MYVPFRPSLLTYKCLWVAVYVLSLDLNRAFAQEVPQEIHSSMFLLTDNAKNVNQSGEAFTGIVGRLILCEYV